MATVTCDGSLSAYYEHGIHTILAMHIDDRDLKELEPLQHPGANLAITGSPATQSG